LPAVLRKDGAVTAEPMRTIQQRSRVRNFLGKAAGRCGRALNSSLAVPGNNGGLCCDVDQPITKRGVMSSQQEQTSFMMLMCHECGEATHAPMGGSEKAGKAVMKNVLVVDDEPSIRGLLADELRYRGYSVIVVRNGSEALDRLETVTPDVIVLDLTMPVMDGWTFVEHCRNRAGSGSIPIIAVSAEDNPPAVDQAFGVTAFLRKPFDLTELANCVARVTRARELSVAPLPRRPLPQRVPPVATTARDRVSGLAVPGMTKPIGTNAARRIADTFKLSVPEVFLDARRVSTWRGPADDLLAWLKHRHLLDTLGALAYLLSLRLALHARPRHSSVE
jgi:CheY-like chemotaxis protein